MKYISFLHWFIFFNLILVAGFLCWHFGVFELLWHKDFTKISFVILAIFGITTLRLGHISLKPCKKKLKLGWYVSTLSMSLGLFATITAMCFMLGEFSNINVADQTSIQNLITHLGINMSTAFYTTLVGLASSILLRMQTFLLERYI